MTRRALGAFGVLMAAVAVAGALAYGCAAGGPPEQVASAHTTPLSAIKDEDAASSTACPKATTLIEPISQSELPCLQWEKGSAVGTTPGAAITSAAKAITLVSHNPGLLSAPGRTGAVETTWQEYETLSSTGRTSVSPTVDPPRTPVWVACASGESRPEFAAPGTTRTYSWVCAAYDVSTGIELSETMGPTSWPTWFTRLSAVASRTA